MGKGFPTVRFGSSGCSYLVVICFEVRQYILIDNILQGDHNMSSEQDDKTTTKHLAITFVLFVVLGIVLIIGANMIG